MPKELKGETRGYPCEDCGETFVTAEDFSNHFSRNEGAATIETCRYTPAGVKKLRKAAA